MLQDFQDAPIETLNLKQVWGVAQEAGTGSQDTEQESNNQEQETRI